MKMRALRVILVLALLGWASLPLRAEEANRARIDALIQRLLAAPADGVDAILQENQSMLGTDLLGRLVGLAVEKADAHDVPQARTRAELADHVDFFRSGKKSYEGIAQLHVGTYLLRDKKDPASATAIADRMLAFSSTCWRGHLLRARIHLAAHDADKAEVALQQVIAIHADSEEAHLSLGYVYVVRNDAKAAKAEMEAVLRINPKNTYARDGLASLNAPASGPQYKKEAMEHFSSAEKLFAAGKYPEAIAEYQAAIRIEPGYVKAHVYLGDCYYALDRWDECMACYKKAIAIDPKDRQAHRFLGNVYEQRYRKTHDASNLDEAIRCYENAVKADPSYSTAVADLERARKLKAEAKP